MAMIYFATVQALNIYLGYSNILALSHVAFTAIGAYASALITLNGGSTLTGFLVGIILCASLGFIVGLSSIKLDADYLGIATLGFTMIVNGILLNWSEVTRGPLGLPGIPRPEVFGYRFATKIELFIFISLISIFLLWIMWRLVKSPYGRILETIREDETAAQSLGHNTTNYKLQVFVIGSVIAGITGGMWSHFLTFIDPKFFVIADMGLLLVMLLVGGAGTFRGPFYGVLFILLIQEGVTFLPIAPQLVGSLQLFLYSFLFLAVLMYFPEGIGGYIKNKKRGRKQLMNY